MKKISTVFLFFCLAICSVLAKQNKNSLTVYAYDSFAGPWGAGTKIAEDFEKETGIHVNLVSCSGAPEMYEKILAEQKRPKADLVIGLNDSMTVDQHLFEAWQPSCTLEKDIWNNLVPFDYGTFAFIFNTANKEGLPQPSCLEDLTKDIYKNNIILIDPRTSSVGAGLLTWTITALGEKRAFEWFEKISANTLTVASSWSMGYGLFTENEAAIVISYSTSPVYHILTGGSTPYKALEFTDGHIDTTEYLGILRSSQHKQQAMEFCNKVLTSGQTEIAITNTMFPANKNTILPKAFDNAMRPAKKLEVNKSLMAEKNAQYLSEWTKAMTK